MINPPNPLFKGGIKQNTYSPLEKGTGGLKIITNDSITLQQKAKGYQQEVRKHGTHGEAVPTKFAIADWQHLDVKF
jgi:hypothetical protein